MKEGEEVRNAGRRRVRKEKENEGEKEMRVTRKTQKRQGMVGRDKREG